MENAYIPQLSIQPTFGTSPQDDSPDISLCKSQDIFLILWHFTHRKNIGYRSLELIDPSPHYIHFRMFLKYRQLLFKTVWLRHIIRIHASHDIIRAMFQTPRSKLSPNPDFPPKESPFNSRYRSMNSFTTACNSSDKGPSSTKITSVGNSVCAKTLSRLWCRNNALSLWYKGKQYRK